MKKMILVLATMMMLATMLMGCAGNPTNTEQELIERATQMIEEKYEVEIEQEAYTYELGAVVDEDQFATIKEGETPEMVFVRGANKGEPRVGKVFDFSIQFNTMTDEIINSECQVYKG
ncbi:MAG: hypothetical protein ACRCW2_01845 [Cellulosilyticaceae bacterium]